MIFPTWSAKSVFELDYDELYRLGYRGIVFDVDATLVPHGRPVTPQVIELFEKIHKIGFKTLLLSNNSDERLNAFNAPIGTLVLANANKPNPANYHQAVAMLNLDKSAVLMVGDQLFTDILGANRAGLASVLVDFLPQVGETALGKKRATEKALMSLYRLVGGAKAIGS